MTGMSLNRKLVIVAIIATCALSHLEAQWAPLNLPYGQSIHGLVRMDTLMFAATAAGVFKSSLESVDWFPANGNLPKDEIFCIAAIGTEVFAAPLNSRGLYATSDNGVNWSWRADGITGVHYVFTPLVRCVISAGDLLLAGTSDGVYASTDHGLHWTPRVTGLTDADVSGLAQLGRFVFAGTYSGGVFRMSQGDPNWTLCHTGLTDGNIISMLSDGTTVYAGTRYSGVYASSDSGATWVARNDGMGNVCVHALGLSGSTIIAGTDSGLFRTSNGGANWVGDGAASPKGITFCLSAFGEHLFAATSAGCYESATPGAAWRFCNKGISQTRISSLATIDSMLLIGTANQGILVADPTRHNAIANEVDLKTCNAATFVGSLHEIFAGGQGVGVQHSTDCGMHWANTSPAPPSPRVYALLMNNETLFAGGNGGVFRSTDKGATWTDAGDGLAQATVYCLLQDNANLYAGTPNGIAISTNNGGSWTVVRAGLPATDIYALTTIGSYLLAGLYSGPVHRSSDGGQHWSSSGSGMPAATVVTGFIKSMGLVFAGTWDGLFVSSDQGATWDSVNSGLPNRMVLSLAVAGRSLYAGTPDGVFERDLSEITSVGSDASISVPAQTILYQNYPNPFNPTTDIRYQISDIGYLKLAVYDILGREVAVLVDEVKFPGSYSVTWDATGCASGVYYCRLTAGSTVTTKQMVLLR
jgi:hypothetical protein